MAFQCLCLDFLLLVFDLPNNIKIKSACSEIIVPCIKGRTEGMLKVRKWDASPSWAILFFKIAVVTHVFAIALCIMYIQDSLSNIRISFHTCIFSISAPWRGVIHEVVFIYLSHGFIINSCRSFGGFGAIRSKNSAVFHKIALCELSGGYSACVCVHTRMCLSRRVLWVYEKS